MVIKPLSYTAPTLDKTELPGGAVLLSATDSSLPYVTLSLQFRPGTSAEPVDSTGSLKALASLIQLGGAGDLDGDTLAEVLTGMGAEIKISPSYENWTVRMKVLTKHFDRTFSIMEDMLLRPRLPADRLEVIKDSLLTEINQRNDDPSSIARRRIMEVMYPGMRMGSVLQKSNVDSLSVDSLRQDLERRLSSDGLIIGASGDLDAVDLKGKLHHLLGQFGTKTAPADEGYHWSGLEAEQRDLFEKNPFYGKIVLVRSSAGQSVVVTGTHLPPHNHPDFFALQTGNYILGGGSFNSRLMREIRAKRGLAYYAYSANAFSAEFGRYFSASGTRVEQTTETLGLMLSIPREMDRGPDQEELSLAQDAILNSLVFQFEDPESFVESETKFLAHKMPDRYIEIFPEKIEGIRTQDIQSIARKYWNPDNFFIVVVGPESLKGELEKIRPVVVVDPEEPLIQSTDQGNGN